MTKEYRSTRWWRVSLRDLFLATAILSLACGWWTDRRRLDGEIQQVRNMKQEEFLRNLGISSDSVVVLKTKEWSVNAGLPKKKSGTRMAATPEPGQLEGLE